MNYREWKTCSAHPGCVLGVIDIHGFIANAMVHRTAQTTKDSRTLGILCKHTYSLFAGILGQIVGVWGFAIVESDYTKAGPVDKELASRPKSNTPAASCRG